MEQISVKQTSPLHHEWLRWLDFYHFELFLIQEQLDEVAEDRADKDILERAKHFKDRLTICKNDIDRLRNRVRENLARLAIEIADETNIEYTLKAFEILNQECLSQQQSVNELKKEFNHFNTELV
ncbi:hypothetical protein ACEN9X_26955 [Mucilaginibacter sp. Mucisp86]|uniref:hypothetical protein n=1 Tax=Mucilaginibacter sp. Mucisp86 TaxID=3243060 RepID=UPI0039B68F46